MMRTIRKLAAVFILLVVFFLSACHKEQYDMNDFHDMYGTGSEAGSLLEKLNGMKIYFGHQSVGRNILSGIEYWEKESGVQLLKAESRSFPSVSDIPFVHFPIGTNNYAIGKIDDFVTLVEQIPEEEKATAFFKLCYVDVYNETDIDAVFSYFKEKMIGLRKRFPNVTLLVCTVPVTGVQTGLKANIKKLVGRAPYGYLDNINRNKFNQLVLSELDGVFPIFDLAALESTKPDGTMETYRYKGNDYPCMPGFYRTDYGHLNEFGAKTISYNLLAFLVEELN